MSKLACVEGVGHLRAKYYANLSTPLDRGMVLLQLSRWKFSHKKTLSQTYSIELEFYSQKRQIRF